MKVPKILKVTYTLNCRTCNPHELGCDPVEYTDQEKRDYEAQKHANKTGHVLDAGFYIA